MREITLPPAKYGDTDNTLLLKWATMAQGGGSVLVPTTLIFSTQPAGAVAGVPFTTQPVVTVKDQHGATLTSFQGKVYVYIATAEAGGSVTALDSATLTPEPGEGANVFSMLATNGVAAFPDLEITTAGDYTLGVYVAETAATPAQSAEFEVAEFWELILDDNFTRANTSPGGAGTTTGAGNGWIDRAGGIYSIDSNQLLGATTVGGSAVLISQELLRPSSEDNITARIVFRTGTSDAQSVWQAMLRKSPTQSKCYAARLSGSSFGLGDWAIIQYPDSNNVGNTLASGTLSPVFDPLHIYEIDFSCSGASPTTIALIIRDITAATTLVDEETTDSVAGNQLTGSYALATTALFGGQPSNTGVSLCRTYGPASILIAGLLSFLTATAGAISVNSSTPVGGTKPYSTQWYRDTVSTFTPGVGNLLTGKTALTITDNTISDGVLYYYKFRATDAAAAVVTSLFLPATTPSTDASTGAIGAETTLVIGAIGDSITAGQGGGDPVASMVTALSPGRTVSAVNASLTGTTSTNWLPGSPLFDDALADFITAGANFAVVMLGTNDSRVLDSVSKATYKSNILAICNALVAEGIKVVLNAPIFVLPGAGSGAWDDNSNVLLKAYQDACAELADDTDIFRGDTAAFPHFADHQEQSVDGIHPNPAGSAALGNLWAAAMIPP